MAQINLSHWKLFGQHFRHAIRRRTIVDHLRFSPNTRVPPGDVIADGRGNRLRMLCAAAGDHRELILAGACFGWVASTNLLTRFSVAAFRHRLPQEIDESIPQVW